MPRHKPKTIKEKGGLKVHVTDMGYDYKLLLLLLRAKLPDTAIASAISVGKPKKVARSTIKHWREIRNGELAVAKEKADKAVDSLRDV